MLDSELLRRDFLAVAANLQRRGESPDAVRFAELETRRKAAQQAAENMRARRNQLARAAVQQPAGEVKAEAAELKTCLQQAAGELQTAQENLEDYLLRLPNMLHDSVPDGAGESANVEVRRWGEAPVFDFTPQAHSELGKNLQQMDFDAAAAMSGARFVVLSGALARLHRALAQWMLDVHIREHGYVEYYTPYLVRAGAMIGAGQLPKFADDLFVADKDGLFMIPTAEVPLMNLARGRIIEAAELPLRLVAHTPCFRREAGSYGKDTRGMLRQHQFDKVELVHMCVPADSYAALEELTGHAERILQLLELPYRVMALCGGDIGFAAAKTYDLEVWMPGQNCYREISSCSNCEAFQARRIKARWRQSNGKPAHLHTLNGSGVAVGRALIALLENGQQADGSVRLPAVLAPYMQTDCITAVERGR